MKIMMKCPVEILRKDIIIVFDGVLTRRILHEAMTELFNGSCREIHINTDMDDDCKKLLAVHSEDVVID